MRPWIGFLIGLVFCFAVISVRPEPARAAVDPRIIVFLKTSGIGTGIGLVAGTALWAMGVGDFHTMMVGGSLGLYGGMLFGAYILATPPDRGPAPNRPGPGRYEPRRPVGPNDWKNEKDDEIENYGPERSGASYNLAPPTEITLLGPPRILTQSINQARSVAVWVPLAQVQF